MSKFKARIGPKMDSARALGIMGFSSTRFMDQVIIKEPWSSDYGRKLMF